MRSKNVLLAVLFLFALISCKDEKKETEATVSTPAAKQNFNVEIDAITNVKDDFAVYYTEDGTNDFTGTMASWKGILGSGKSEKVTFDLPADVIPTHIRLDFGLNKEQGDIVIENIKMDFYGESFSFKGSEFFTYFIASDQFKTEVDQAKGTLTILRGEDGFKTPYFYPTQNLIDAVAKITAQE